MRLEELFVAGERRRLRSIVGCIENASVLFAPKICDDQAINAGGTVLQHLGFESGTNAIYSRCEKLPAHEVAEWASQMWANTVAHLASIDPEVRNILLQHKTCLPEDEDVQKALLEKVHASFAFFLWLIASPTRPTDHGNYCLLKFVVLNDVILLENINSARNGVPGGWGWLDKSISGLRQIGDAYEIRKLKVIATNERVCRAFLNRGFKHVPPVHGLELIVTGFAEPLEFTW